MRRALLLLALSGCGRTAPNVKSCTEEEVPQNGSTKRIPTELESELDAAFSLCEVDPPIIPSAGPVEVQQAPGLSMEDCLRKWLPVIERHPDEPDRQWKMVCK